jgi:DNA repair exonuclease SbcCD ATPase subunit
MPIFRDPDIDRALTAEAQSVVESASKSMMTWLNTSFENIEKSVHDELRQVEAQIAEDREKYEEEDAQRDKEISDLLESLSKATQTLSPLDADNKAVIDSLNEATSKVRIELEERRKRWQSYGSKAVKMTHEVIKKAVGGIL